MQTQAERGDERGRALKVGARRGQVGLFQLPRVHVLAEQERHLGVAGEHVARDGLARPLLLHLQPRRRAARQRGFSW